MPGGMLSLSANGNKPHTGIVWATLPVANCMPSAMVRGGAAHDAAGCPLQRGLLAVGKVPDAIYAFDAETLELLWNDDLRRWDAGIGLSEGAHWAPPTIADGKVFAPGGTGMIVVYTLNQQNAGVAAGTSTPIQPRGPQCNDCHDFTNGPIPGLTMPPLSHIFPNEATINAWPNLALRSIAPPLGQKRGLSLTGAGVEIYQGAPDPKQQGKLTWQLKSSTAELEQAGFSPPTRKAQPPPLRAQLFPNLVLSASDGSTATLRIERTTAAPIRTDAPWVLLKVTKSSGKGALTGLSFIQCVYTVGGAPPSKMPKRRGEIADVPYQAQYWMYR
jgi:hypothetical protein